jgi:hypothetical protein
MNSGIICTRVDEISKMSESQNMNLYMFVSTKIKIIICFFGLLCACLGVSCSVEDFSSITGTETDKNLTLNTTNSINHSSQDLGENALLQMNKDIKNILDSYHAAQRKDMEILLKNLLKSYDKEQVKYQFLGDGHEKWIYRCNVITGEIECFSMSSNKLRLLSSSK